MYTTAQSQYTVSTSRFVNGRISRQCIAYSGKHRISTTDSTRGSRLLCSATDTSQRQTDDSLIRTAVQYYDSIGDVQMQAKAYYYKGCIYRDANLCGEAVQEYLTAISLAKKTGNPKLQGLICNHAGYLYYLQDLLEQADSIYQLTEQLAIQQNDTSLWADALSFQGKINIKQGIPYYPRAEEKLLKAFDMTNTPNYKQLQADIAAALSSLYNSMELNKKAVHYAKLNISLRNDTALTWEKWV